MLRKIIFALAELATIGGGASLFVDNTLKSSFNSYNTDEAGLGAFMIVLGLLIRVWRKEFFALSEKAAPVKESREVITEEKSTNKSLITGLVLICAFTFWGFSNRAAVRSNNEMTSLEREVFEIKTSMDRVKKDVEYIGSKSHRHTYSY